MTKKKKMSIYFLNKETTKMERHKVVLDFIERKDLRVYAHCKNPLTGNAFIHDVSKETWDFISEV